MNLPMKQWISRIGSKKLGKNNKLHTKILPVLIGAQALVFLFVLLFTVVVLEREYASQLQQNRNEQLLALTGVTTDIAAELKTRTSTIWQLTLDVVSDTELFSKPKSDSYIQRYAAYKSIENVCSVNPSIGYVFAVREDHFYLSNSFVASYRQLNLRDAILDLDRQDFPNITLSKWNLIDINGKMFCMLLYHYSDKDTYIGALTYADDLFVRFSGFNTTDNMSINITDASGNSFTYLEGLERPGTDYDLEILNSGLSINGTIYSDADDQIRNILIVLGALALLTVLVSSMIIIRLILHPVYVLSSELHNVEGDLQNISISVNSGVEEIRDLQKSANHLLSEVISSRIRQYELKLKENELELIGLHAQLLPHFYLNAITTVDTLNRQGRQKEIETFLRALTTHIRYMIHANNKPIRLGEELDNISAYITMQEIRCPNQAISIVDCPEDLRNVMIPHLLVYTVVENSFKYAVDPGNPLLLMVRAEKEENEIHITIEDNGKGFSMEEIHAYNSPELLVEPPEGHGRIGLANVKRTLKLLYNRDDLMRLSNHEPHGATVELIFPLRSPDNDK